jgi:hypothetical protein
MQLHYQISTLKKGDFSMTDFHHKFTSLANTLAAIDQPLKDFDLVLFFLAGLGFDYDALVIAIQQRCGEVTLDEVYGDFLSHELRLAQHQPSIDLSLASANFANRSFSNRGGRGCKASTPPASSNYGHNFTSNQQHQHRGRGRGRGNYNSSPHPICQVCTKPGHSALTCYHRFDNSYIVESTPNMQALLATPTHVPDPNWYSDSGATHYLTSDLANLNVRADEYHGPDQIRVGNSTSLLIKHIGSTQFSTPTANFLLNNVLHVPQISKNLISVHKFTKDTNTSMDFRSSCFRV